MQEAKKNLEKVSICSGNVWSKKSPFKQNTDKVIAKIRVLMLGTMELSPNVSPFVPRQQANVLYSSSWKLSPDVAEFVPGWLNNSSASQDRAQASSDASTTKRSKHTALSPSTLETNDQRVETNATPPKPKPSSLKNKNIKKSGKKNMFEPDPQIVKEKAQSWEDNVEGTESDFPALTALAVEKNSSGWLQTAWNKQVPWGVSFSEKVKSSNLNNASSYFHNEPSISLTNDKTKERQKTSLKSKSVTRQEVKLEKKETKKTIDANFVKKSADEMTKSYYDDEGFSIVRHKSKKIHETVEPIKKDKSSFEKEKHHFAWSEDHWDEQANQKSLTVKKFSENQSKSSWEETSCNKHGKEIQKNRSSSLEEWSSGRNITEKKRETMQGPSKGNATKQSSKQNKDYYSFKSTYGVSNSRFKTENGRKELCSEDKETKTRGSNVPVNFSTVEVRPFLSYSDILKSKPNIQLPEPEKLEGIERGILRLPGETSEEGEDDQQEVEEQEGKSKKKKKKKKKSGVEAQPQPVKKSKETLTLDFGDMLAKIMESSTAKRKPVIRTGGLLPAQAPLPPKETRNTKKYEHQASNVLDSTAPMVFHGKEREFPKKRKPSAMRKILIKEREEKKMLREGKSPNEQSLQNEESDKEMSDDQQLDSDDIGLAEVKKSIHSRKFREYCDQDLDYDINGLVIQLLKELIRFQDRLYHKDPVKAKAKRRFVCGLREVHKHAKLKKLKCVIVTPNLEPTKSKGGLDDLLSSIIDVCHSQNVPVIFSLNRQVLGKVLLKKVPVSIVGIFYYDGAQDYFKKLMTLTEVARETYKDKFNRAKEKFMLEKEMVKDTALIEEGLHSTVIEKDESQAITTNDVQDIESSCTGENDIGQDSFGDEKTEESLRINEEQCTIETLALDEGAELLD